jgi:hypothetical protein
MTTAQDTYIGAISIDEMFLDLTYQRDPQDDMARVRKMARQWDVRLVGVLEMSDRGAGTSPRYAVIDGGHRFAAAQCLDTAPALVANVHSGLTVEQEAALFGRLNRGRRSLTTWDHWRARLAAGEEPVPTIAKAVAALDLSVSDAPRKGNVRCSKTLEKLHDLGGIDLVTRTLRLIVDVWGREVEVFDAPLVHGIGLVLHYLREPVDPERLHLTALLDVVPRQLKTRALAMRDHTTGSHAKLVAMAIMDLYNRRPGRKILVSTRTFGPTARNTRSVQAVATAS